MKSPAEVRSERVKAFVAPIVPAILIGLTVANVWIWLANWLREMPNLEQVSRVLVVKLILLPVSAWYIRRAARAGRVEATGIALIWVCGMTSVTTCMVTYYNGNGAMQSMPFGIMVPLLALYFWPRTWHFVVGTLAALAPPLLQLFLTEHTFDERSIYGQLAAGTAVVVVVLYSLVHRANSSIARMTGEIEYRAAYDGLTGLHNRSHWFEQATKRYAACQSAGQPVSLLFLDVDRFKQHNDLAGHVEGDRLLRQIATVLSAFSAPEHLLGRFGGDEFIVLLPDTAQAEADRYADRLREAVSHIETVEGQLSVSVGAQQALPGEDLDQFIARADQTMLAAKAAARSRGAAGHLGVREPAVPAVDIAD